MSGTRTFRPVKLLEVVTLTENDVAAATWRVAADNEEDAVAKVDALLDAMAIAEPVSEGDIDEFNRNVSRFTKSAEFCSTHPQMADIEFRPIHPLPLSEKRLLEKAKVLYAVPPHSAAEIRAQFHCSAASATRVYQALYGIWESKKASVA